MGGGGGSKNTTTTTIAEPPKWAVPYFKDYYNAAADLASDPYTPYTGQLVADFSPQQVAGMDMAQQTALGGTPYADYSMMTGMGIMGTPIYNQSVNYGGGNPYMGMTTPGAGSYTSDTALGQAYTGDAALGNTYTGNAALGNAYTGQAYTGNAVLGDASSYYNPYLPSVGDPGSNPYYGPNSYLENMINQTTSGVVDDYLKSTVPQLNAMEMQQGAFGNTGLQQMKLQAANDLTTNLGDIQDEYRFKDYTTQQQLGEADLNRRLGAAQFQANLAQQGGQYNADNLQNMTLANMNAANQFGLQNLGALNQMELANMGAMNQQGQANQSALNQMELANMGALNQTELANMGALNNMTQYNLGSLNQQELANMAALNNMGQFNAGQLQTGDQFNSNLFQNDLARNSSIAEQIAQRIYGASGQDAANLLNAQQIDQSGDLQAMGMAPTLEQLRYLPSEQMMTIGDLIQQQNQQYLSSDYDRWMSEQMYPYQQLDLMQNALATIMGGGGTTTTSAPNAAYGNTFANLLGGGLMTYGLFN